jgi:hypothetical protein
MFEKKQWFLFYETFLLRSGPLDCTLLLLVFTCFYTDMLLNL